jgi:hypothetical protein
MARFQHFALKKYTGMYCLYLTYFSEYDRNRDIEYEDENIYCNSETGIKFLNLMYQSGWNILVGKIGQKCSKRLQKIIYQN